MNWLRRWTGFYLLSPHRYFDPRAIPDDFNIAAWSSAQYEHAPDPWMGFQDHVQPVEETLSTGIGDCVDYSAVVLSWLLRTSTPKAVMMVCRSGTTGHLAIAANASTYSSGRIVEETPEEYYDRTKYSPVFHRTVGMSIDEEGR